MAPAASICVAQHRPQGWTFHSGASGWLDPRRTRPVALNTPFDLASITKPFIALAAATLAVRAGLVLSSPLRTYLPELCDFDIGRKPIDLLLSHRAALVPHWRLFVDRLRSNNSNRYRLLQQLARQVSASDAEHQGEPPSRYSDLGYLLIGEVIERLTHSALDEVVRHCLLRWIDGDLGSSRQWHQRTEDFRSIVPPTEFAPWRGGLVRGAVHDENAWVWAGHGLSGHAGLFGTALAVAKLGCAVLDALAGRASPVDRFAAIYCTAPRRGGTHRAGFDGKTSSNSTAGPLMSRHSFGHLGFTGTSLWCDPVNEWVVVILTNRVCPTRNNTRLVQSRSALNEELCQLLLSGTLGGS